jgi:hypothetical protein
MTRNTRKARHAPETSITRDDISDVPRLLAELASLQRELARARRRAANLEAAIHAALSARDDGETDPFYYLRDEITHGRGDAYGA